MSTRLKIYTKTGDKGQTSLYGGRRVEKYDQRVVAYGTVDELNSALGVLIAQFALAARTQTTKRLPPNDVLPVKTFLLAVQSDLFSVGAYLAGNAKQPLERLIKRTKEMEQGIDTMDSQLPELKNFILPSGTPAAAFAHLARSICRRAEREVVRLADAETVASEVLQYLNRLSDLLFVLARYLTLKDGKEDQIWKQT